MNGCTMHCVCMYVCMCVCMYVCMCIYIICATMLSKSKKIYMQYYNNFMCETENRMKYDYTFESTWVIGIVERWKNDHVYVLIRMITKDQKCTKIQVKVEYRIYKNLVRVNFFVDIYTFYICNLHPINALLALYPDQSYRIICSADITRQNLNRKLSTSDISDDEDELFKKLKSKIDKDLLSCQRGNYKPANYVYRNISLSKKKRPIIDEESLNVIKRFKMDANRTNIIHRTLNDINIVRSTSVASSVLKEAYNETMNPYSLDNRLKNISRQENLFTSHISNTNCRNPSNKYVFQMSSKIQGNDTELTEYKELLLFTFLTPPDNNSNEI
ncbi:uncharacterized protein LOC143177386 [Calliopsis andreniformis]|uniref:uncharacterized protein LOC143177386 n=1 Tax=Calliopsis andreniformis TaxID=337506 RepID=UPI003FCDAED3